MSAALLFALLLPGQIAHYTYKRRTNAWSNSGSNLYAIPTSLVWGLLFVLPLNFVWGFVSAEWMDKPVNYDAVVSLLTNESTEKYWFKSPYYDSWVFIGWTCLYWFTQCSAGVAAGWAISKIAVALNWPSQVALRSNGATWHRLFLAKDWSEQPDAVTASAVVVEDDRSYVYSGIVNTYDLNPAGDLQRLVLEGAYRRDFPSRNANGGEESKWVEMRGEMFVLNCENVQTIDVDYVWLDGDGGHHNTDNDTDEQSLRD